MRPRKTPYRIGIFEPPSDGWAAGPKYIRTMAQSLGKACQAAGIELYVLCDRKPVFYQNHNLLAKIVPLLPPSYFRGEWRLRQLLGMYEKSSLLYAAREHQISVLLPLLPLHAAPFRASSLKFIGWIPDFQHVYLPEFFPEAECRYRDHTFRLLAQRSALVMVSSQDALDHFGTFIPEYAHKARVVPFPSLYAYESFEGDTVLTQRKFNLPVKFALVANQFWRHKNHQVVIDAISQLRRKDMHIHIVMTGLPVDSRDPNNETTSRILQAIASAGLVDKITVLGMVSFQDLTNLMRTAAVVIQPSRFEGWSTVVQDCKALGRPLICSDIPVHREQAPQALGFFPCDRADILADSLAANWTSLEPGPNRAMEEQALAGEREFARLHGQSLLRICQEANSS